VNFFENAAEHDHIARGLIDKPYNLKLLKLRHLLQSHSHSCFNQMSTAKDFKDSGNVFLQAGNFSEAITAYTKAIELDPTDHVFYSNRSAAYLSAGEAEKALEDGQKCTEISPKWAKGHSRKGAALHALKRYDEASDAYEVGLEIAPEDAGLTSGLAEVLKAKTASERTGGGGLGGLFSPQMLTKLVGHPKFGPKLSDPTFMMKIQMMQSNPQLLMKDPEMMEVLQVLLGGSFGGDDADAEDAPFAPSATSSSNAPKPAPSKPDADENLSAAEKESKKRKQSAVAAKERGNALYKEKKFDEAIAAYDEAFSIDENMMFMNNKAAVMIEMGQCQEAIEVCTAALEVGKKNRATFEDRAKVFQRIAAAYLKMDNIPSALESYSKAQMEQFDKAIERKVKLLELELRKKASLQYINPELGLAAKEKGNAAFRDGDFPTAIREYEEAIKRDPTNAPYNNNLAAAFLKVGLFNDAKRHVEKSIELDKNYVKAWAKKGDIEFFMKEYHKSLESYKMGLSLEPDNSLCKQGLSKTIAKINEASSDDMDAERVAHARADPDIQAILQDPMIQQVLRDFQENPQHANKAMSDPGVRAKIEKLIASGILAVK
jgi:stress-induced-phosphoprotein 1